MAHMLLFSLREAAAERWTLRSISILAASRTARPRSCGVEVASRLPIHLFTAPPHFFRKVTLTAVSIEKLGLLVLIDLQLV